MTTTIELKNLYEIDYYEWLETTIKLLKQQQLTAIDYEHLIEELESVGKSEKNAVESLLEQVIIHLLLYQYWINERARNSKHWRLEIYTFRTQLQRKLTTNLSNYLDSQLPSIYKDALGYVELKTDLTIFPLDCPYTLTQLLDKTWLPQI